MKIMMKIIMYIKIFLYSVITIVLTATSVYGLQKKMEINDSNGGCYAWTLYDKLQIVRRNHTYPEYRCFDTVPRCGPYNGFPRERLFLIECTPDALDTVLQSDEKNLKTLQDVLKHKKHGNIFFNIVVFGEGSATFMIKFHGLLLSYMGNGDNVNVSMEMGCFAGRGVTGVSMPWNTIGAQSVHVHDKLFSPSGVSEINQTSKIASVWAVAYSPENYGNKKTVVNFILLLNDYEIVSAIRKIIEDKK